MLVLTRHKGEEIVIDGNIVITVVAVKGNAVRLGITAPASVRVNRLEVHKRHSEFAAEGSVSVLPSCAVLCDADNQGGAYPHIRP